MGLCLQALAFAVALYSSPDMRNAPPAWVYLLASAALLAYQTLDNMDGKQARRTGSSSPLGILFDYTCGAINAGLLGWAVVAISVQSGPGWRALCCWLLATAPLYYNTWQQLEQGSVTLPVVNGPSEGVLVVSLLLLLTAFFGPEGLWSSPNTTLTLTKWLVTPGVDALRYMAGESLAMGAQASTGMGAYWDVWVTGLPPNVWVTGLPPNQPGPAVTNLELLLTIALAAAAFKVGVQIMSVVRQAWRAGGPEAAGRALSHQAPFLLLVVVMASWLREPACRRVVHDHWALFYGTAGCLFVDMSVRVMVAHMTEGLPGVDAVGLVMFALAPAVLAADLMPAGPDHSAFAALCLLLSLLCTWIPTPRYLYRLFDSLCGILDCGLLSIARQTGRRAVHAPATCALEAASMRLAVREGTPAPLAAPSAKEALQATGADRAVHSAIQTTTSAGRRIVGEARVTANAMASQLSTAMPDQPQLSALAGMTMHPGTTSGRARARAGSSSAARRGSTAA